MEEPFGIAKAVGQPVVGCNKNSNSNVSNIIEEHNKYVTNMLFKAHSMNTLQQMRYRKNILTHIYQLVTNLNHFCVGLVTQLYDFM
jgi:hypothetical protein